MSKKVKVLPFPDWLLKIKYSLILYNGLTEEGEPKKALDKKGLCIFSEKSKRIIDPDGKRIVLLGKVIIKGDISPKLTNISDGVITINDCSYEIHSCSRPRNPDGTIHHTTLELK